MSEKSFTLLEIRLGDGDVQFGPKSLGDRTSRTSETESAETDVESADGADGGSSVRRLGTALVVLALLAAAAFAAWKRYGDSDLDAAEELDELETVEKPA